MAEERKGGMTEAQENTLERILVFKNKLYESGDGLAIKMLDNQVIDRILKVGEEKLPGSKEIAYQVIDSIFEMLDSMFPEDEEK